MKQCPFCRGLIEDQRIEHVHRWERKLYLLRNVPAEVCTQCGEVFFAPEALKAMDKIVEGKREPLERLSVPVYSL
ncbi:MAG: YgiT-type zinc finger protein [Chloroflexi bacterium]|nr:YgiT-type zinc finger protein [Chloroflexota bacterium]